MSEAPAIGLGLRPVTIFGRHPKVRDLLAASPLIVWYAGFIFYQWHYLSHIVGTIHSTELKYIFAMNLATKALAFAFGVVLICLLVVRRAPVKRQQTWAPRFIAFLGCYVGIGALVMPVNPPPSPWLFGSMILVVGGTAFALYSLMWLGRSVSIMPESRKLVTSGPYSLIRHPLYFGEQTALVGIALQCTTVWPVLVLVLQFCCQLYRMRYEEQILTESFPEYEAYCRDTARIIPWLY